MKVRDAGSVTNRTVHLGNRGGRGRPQGNTGPVVGGEGRCPVLADGTERAEGSRGIQDILIAVVDGLQGFADALETVFPVVVQTCIVYLLRHSLSSTSYTNWWRL